MRRVFKTRPFSRWMRKTTLTEAALYTAVIEMTQGLIDADLGSGVVKKRVALPGRGKRGSTRTLVATNKDDLWFLVFGFAKNDRDDVSPQERAALQRLAQDLLALPALALEAHVETGALEEMCHDNEAACAEPPDRDGARDRP